MSIEEKLEEIRAEVARLRGHLRKARTDKGPWHRVTAVSGIVAAILLPAVGGFATYVYNQRQLDLNARQLELVELETVEKFLPHLTSSEPSPKGAAIIALCALGRADLSVALAESFADEAAINSLAKLSSTAENPCQRLARKALARFPARLTRVSTDEPAETLRLLFRAGSAQFAQYTIHVWNRDQRKWDLLGEGNSFDDNPDAYDLGPARRFIGRDVKLNAIFKEVSSVGDSFSAELSLVQNDRSVWTQSYAGPFENGVAFVADVIRIESTVSQESQTQRHGGDR